MRMNIIFTTLAVIFFYFASSVEGRCEDRWVGCPAYDCKYSLVRRNCKQSCDGCGKNPCEIDNGGCQHLCSWDGNNFQCSCNSGFRLNTTDQSSCIDINECTEGPNPCVPFGSFYCINTIGSYSCQINDCRNSSNGVQMNYYRSDKCCNLENSNCGLTPNIRSKLPRAVDSRIIMGDIAQLGQWPWQAQIVFQHGPHCGASLITEKWLIGAAHCFTTASHTEMFVYLGHIRNALTQTMDSDKRVQRRISRVIMHENYDNYTSDVALIELDRPVQLNDSVTTICLPCGEYPAVGDKCWATGFGRTIETDDDSFPEFLQEVDLPIVDGSECQKAYQGVHPINPDLTLCAGYQQGRKDACFGDSGGPLACQRSDSCEWYLAGITSFGRGCGRPEFYGVYVNVINYEDWIRRTLGNEAPPQCKRTYNPCRGKSNIDTDCYQKLDFCEEYPHYMGTNCNYACCQLSNNEIRNCFDFEGVTPYCKLQKALGNCAHTLVQTICRLTCELC